MSVDYRVLIGTCTETMRTLPEKSVHTCVTSPPYFGLRDYGHDGQIGLETTPDEFVEALVHVFREVRRVLRDDGTVWLNLGDSYAGGGNGGGGSFAKDGIRSAPPGTDKNKATRFGKRGAADGLKPKDLIGIPWRVAFALQADGWYLRQDIIWSKPNPMPESVRDRCTKAHEYVFLLSKSPRYYYDIDTIKEPLADSSVARLSQDIDSQAGSKRVPGKTNGAMKAVSARDNFRRENSKRSMVIPGQSVGSHRPDRPDSTPGTMRNRRSVWTVSTRPYRGAHFATFPPALIEPCILAGCPAGGTVLDPFGGSGTTAGVALENGRHAVLCELNPAYVPLIDERINDLAPRWVANQWQGDMFAEVVP